MSNKGIGFRLNEQTVVEEVFIEQGVYNGFGKIRDLPSIRELRRKPIGFSSKDLGKLFVEIGTKLQSMNDDIKIIRIETSLRENPIDMGKHLLFEMTYREIEKWHLNY